MDCQQKYGNPAESVRDPYEENVVGQSHIFPQLCSIDSAFRDGVEHAGIGEEDDEESHQV